MSRLVLRLLGLAALAPLVGAMTVRESRVAATVSEQSCTAPKGEYNPEKDVSFYSDVPDMYFQLTDGQFAIFFPEDVPPLCIAFRTPWGPTSLEVALDTRGVETVCEPTPAFQPAAAPVGRA